MQDCRLDLLFSGNTGTASLHLKHLKEDCLDIVFWRTDDERNVVRKDQIVVGNVRQASKDVRRGRGVSLPPVPESTTTSLGSISSIVGSLCLNDCSGNGKCDSGNTYV